VFILTCYKLVGFVAIPRARCCDDSARLIQLLLQCCKYSPMQTLPSVGARGGLLGAPEEMPLFLILAESLKIVIAA
jgi:hypothetical protein